VRIVLDASAALRLVMRMEDAAALADRLERASLVLSPSLFQAETANALWKYVQADQLTLDQALVRLEEALALVDVQIPDAELATESLASACQYRHPVYDLLYAVAARRHAGGVLTRDHRLVKLLREMDIAVIEVA
jgi:predicted nucleic acid-binding protein